MSFEITGFNNPLQTKKFANDNNSVFELKSAQDVSLFSDNATSSDDNSENSIITDVSGLHWTSPQYGPGGVLVHGGFVNSEGKPFTGIHLGEDGTYKKYHNGFEYLVGILDISLDMPEGFLENPDKYLKNTRK